MISYPDPNKNNYNNNNNNPYPPKDLAGFNPYNNNSPYNQPPSYNQPAPYNQQRPYGQQPYNPYQQQGAYNPYNQQGSFSQPISQTAPYSQPGSYSQPAPYAQPGSYSQPAPYAQPGSYSQPAPYTQPGSYSQPAPYAQSGSFSQPAPYTQPGSFSQPTPYTQPGSFSQPAPYNQQPYKKSTSYDPYGQNQGSYDSYRQQSVYNGPGDPYLVVPGPYPPQNQPVYNGPGDPYLVAPYNNNPNVSNSQQPWNAPVPNSAPVFYQPPPEYYQQHKISNCQGNKKALLVGINYIGQQFQLKGCINDANNVKELLTTRFGFIDSPDKMIVLTDDTSIPSKMPTRKNIIEAMKWLVRDCKPGDSLFFHFSGHGSQTKDLDGDEVDGYDETILPVDYKKSGQIVDDEMNAIMVRPLPEGVRLTAIFDSCHSGTALDLPYIYGDDGKLVIQKGPSALKTLNKTLGSIMHGDILGTINNVIDLAETDKLKKNSEKAKKKTEETRSTFADVVMLSGCKDSQTSADTKINNISTGAMSYAFIKTLVAHPDLTYLQLLRETRKHLINFRQKPQLSSGRLMDINQKFIM